MIIVKYLYFYKYIHMYKHIALISSYSTVTRSL